MKWGFLALNLIWLTFLYLIFASAQNDLQPIYYQPPTYDLPPNTTLACDNWGCVYIPICITESCLEELIIMWGDTSTEPVDDVPSGERG